MIATTTRRSTVPAALLAVLWVAGATPASADNVLSTGITDRALAEHYAPAIYQDVADGADNDPDNFRRDFLIAADFDGDWDPNNNVENMQSKAYPLRAFVYFDVVETGTHYTIVYSYFHPEDWNSFGGTDHENDQENQRVIVEKDGTTFGRFLLTDYNAHGQMNANTDRSDVTKGQMPAPAQFRTAGVQFEDSAGNFSETFSASYSHVRTYIEPRGHGPASCAEGTKPFGFLDGKPECNATAGTDKVIYRVAPGGNPADAGEPDTSAIRSGGPHPVVGYVLLSGYDAYWPRRQWIEGDAGVPGLWDEPFSYAPGRNGDADGSNDFALQSGNAIRMGSDFAGDEGNGGGVPPWGFGSVPGISAKGDWLFDPAYVTASVYEIPNEGAAGYCNYLFNPYLLDLLASAIPTTCGIIDEGGGGGGCALGGTGGTSLGALPVLLGLALIRLRSARRVRT